MKMRFVTVQYVRAFCTFAIVLTHAGLHFGSQIPFGEGRVALFFIMSGFLLWWITAGRNNNVSEFLARRVARIIPLYWLVTTIVVVVSWCGVSPDKFVSVGNFVKSLLFLPYGEGWHGQFYPALKPGWTLSYEMFFCCVFTAALYLNERMRFVVLTIILGGLGLAGLALQSTTPVAATLTGFPMLEILTGIWIARYWRYVAIGPAVCWCLIFCGVVVSFAVPLFVEDSPEVVASAPRALGSALIIIVGALALERPGTVPVRWIKYIGDASYSIYLWHWPLMTLMVKVIAFTHIILPMELCIVCATILSIGMGCILYEVFERPVTKRLMAWIDGWKRPAKVSIEVGSMGPNI